MANKRKYPEVVGYWVYSIKIPSINKYYIGISKRQCCERWQKKEYKGIVIEPYLDEWDSMEKKVIQDNLTKEEALKKEDELIQELNDLCINERRSGLIANDKNAYYREYYQNNTEYRERCNQRKKQRYENDAEYREQQKKRNRQSRLKKRLEKQQQTSLL